MKADSKRIQGGFARWMALLAASVITLAAGTNGGAEQD
jgi:hypothetical protein